MYEILAYVNIVIALVGAGLHIFFVIKNRHSFRWMKVVYAINCLVFVVVYGSIITTGNPVSPLTVRLVSTMLLTTLMAGALLSLANMKR